MDKLNNLLNQLKSLVEQNKLMFGVALLLVIYFVFLKPKKSGFEVIKYEEEHK